MSFHARNIEEQARVLTALKTETEDIKTRLVAVSARCHELENIKTSESQDYKPTSDVETVQELLRDALEKNQQWLAYDQQREAYVTSVLTRIYQLEQQQGLTGAAAQQQPLLKAPDSDARNCQETQQQYVEVLKKCEGQLNQEFERIAQAQTELEQLKRKVEDKQEELFRVQSLLQSNQKDLDQTQMHIHDRKQELDQVWHQIREKNGDLSEVQDLLQSKWAELEELQNQIQVKQCELHQMQNEKSQIQQQLKDHKTELRKDMTLQEVLHKQHEEQARAATLETQVLRLAEDIQEQKCEKQHLQKQLHKALKDLSKAHNYISKLEDELDKVQSKTGNCEVETQPVQERQVRQSYHVNRASPGVPTPLDESFLECPNCQIQYPASRHRELVTHIDQCCR